MSKKAVWLSDIEFIEMHSSDWERLESEAFEPDESVQAQLNPNQQVVLDWLKKHFYKENDNYPLVSVCRFVEEDTGDECSDVGLAYGYLTMKQEAQVLLAFANWTMEQEEE
ncbi:hypothetical protein ACVV5U_02055 [Enterococcus faecalis]